MDHGTHELGEVVDIVAHEIIHCGGSLSATDVVEGLGQGVGGANGATIAEAWLGWLWG